MADLLQFREKVTIYRKRQDTSAGTPHTQQELAQALGLPYQRINELINGRRALTPSTALRLAKYFGNSASFWMSLQLRWDLYEAQSSEAKFLKKIRPLRAAG